MIAHSSDPDYTRSLLAETGRQVAAIIVEPLQRIIPPEPGFLALLRAEADRHGILLIFDEVVTVSWPGLWRSAGSVWRDPRSLFARQGARGQFSPCRRGWSSGHPGAFRQGRGGTGSLADADRHPLGQPGCGGGGTEEHGDPAPARPVRTSPRKWRTADGHWGRTLAERGVAHRIVGHPSLFEVVFTGGEVRNYRDFVGSDMERWTRYNRVRRENGIFKPPGQGLCVARTRARGLRMLREGMHPRGRAGRGAGMPALRPAPPSPISGRPECRPRSESSRRRERGSRSSMLHAPGQAKAWRPDQDQAGETRWWAAG